MENFALVGAAGYVAPRHMRAIHDTGNRLVAALDPHDAVGVIDGYFPAAHFFTEFERFDRHIDKLRRRGLEERIHYLSVCSPNYLHDAHIRFGLRSDAHVICEKPIVLNPWNLDGVREMEQDCGKRVYTILQLRLHPALIALRSRIQASLGSVFDVDLVYITPRGHWYLSSWKGDREKSGGLATNIGIHFFDMLIWLFGPVESSDVSANEPRRAAGRLLLERARVNWYLSCDSNDCVRLGRERGAYRSMRIDGSEVEFSDGFTDLHTDSYRHILAGNGFGIEEAAPSVALAQRIRNSETKSSALPSGWPFDR